MWQREAKPITDHYSNLTTELMALFSITSHPNPFKAIHTLTKTHKVTHTHNADRRKTKRVFKDKRSRRERKKWKRKRDVWGIFNPTHRLNAFR